MYMRRRFVAFALLAVLAIVGCDQQGPPVPTPTATSPALMPTSGPAITATQPAEETAPAPVAGVETPEVAPTAEQTPEAEAEPTDTPVPVRPTPSGPLALAAGHPRLWI